MDKLKKFFIKPVDAKSLQEMLHENLLSFKFKFPQPQDYRFQQKNYSLATRLQYPDDYNYIFDSEDEAFIAGVISFDKNIYSQLDDYILQVLKQYKERQLKIFLTYEPSKENFYYKTNGEVEKRLEKIFAKLGQKNIPQSLKTFSCLPNFDKLPQLANIENFVPAIRRWFERLHTEEDFTAYGHYIQTKQSAYSDKKFAFHIDRAVKIFFDNILWVTDFFTRTSDDLRDNIHSAISESYAENFSQELKQKSAAIQKFFFPK